MEKLIESKKAEMSVLLKEFKRLISKHSDIVEDKINNRRYNDFDDLKDDHYELATLFQNFMLYHNFSYNKINEQFHYVMKNFDYILDKSEEITNKQPINNEETIDDYNDEIIDSDDESIDNKNDETIDSDNESINNDEPIDNNNEETINNINSTINNKEPMNNDLIMISNILKEPTMNNKQSLISDILNKLMISDIMNQPIDNDSKELLINNTLKHSITCKIVAQPNH